MTPLRIASMAGILVTNFEAELKHRLTTETDEQELAHIDAILREISTTLLIIGYAAGDKTSSARAMAEIEHYYDLFPARRRDDNPA